MDRKIMGYIVLFFLILCPLVKAQDQDLQSYLDDRVNRMTTELKLTDNQADAVRPVIKEYIVKKQAILQEAQGQGIVDHVAIKGTLKGLKEVEYQKLSKILTEDQLKRWIQKEILRATLNPDSTESQEDDGVSMTPTGANFKF